MIHWLILALICPCAKYEVHSRIQKIRWSQKAQHLMVEFALHMDGDM